MVIPDLLRNTERFFSTQGRFETVAVSATIAEKAAELRAAYSLRTPDCIQIATAIAAGATSFLTNDAQLAGPWIPNVLVLNQIAGKA